MTEQLDTELPERGGQMSFLEHLDELRKRLVNSVIIIVLAFVVCFYFSDRIFDFLSVPIRRALSEAERIDLPVKGKTGDERIVPLSNLKDGETGVYVFDRATKLGPSVIAPGTSVAAVVGKDAEGVAGVFTSEPIVTNNGVIPQGVRLPVDLTVGAENEPTAEERLIVTTAPESFTLYVTVSLYSAIALSVPLLLLQIWGFISPALYKHERAYVTPFILLSSTSFILGAAFAYYILFPPAVAYLLGLGADFRLLLRATDYFDFITLIMLAMGIIFQMPAITYVLSRIGIISAGFLLRSWKLAVVIILIVAAVVSPTGDIPNMMLFAAPMMVLYVVSIGIAWFFGRKRQTDAAIAAS
jgi:sec-independent protein translocase protein TatC